VQEVIAGPTRSQIEAKCRLSGSERSGVHELPSSTGARALALSNALRIFWAPGKGNGPRPGPGQQSQGLPLNPLAVSPRTGSAAEATDPASPPAPTAGTAAAPLEGPAETPTKSTLGPKGSARALSGPL